MKDTKRKKWNRPKVLKQLSIKNTYGPVNRNARESTGGPKNYS